jgi:hypothetical protein
MLRAFVNCAMVLKKRLNFFFFQCSKVDQVRSEYSPQLSYFKGLSLDRGQADFCKKPPRRFL